MTPASVRYGQVEEIQEERAQVLAPVYSRTPEQFVLGPPRPPAQPTATWMDQQTRGEGGCSVICEYRVCHWG